MKLALIFYLKDSLGGAERRFIRIYNELCADNHDFHCDIVVRGCDKKKAIDLFAQADCNTEHIDNIVAFKNAWSCLAYLFFDRSYEVIHFFGASKFNIAVEKLCHLRNKKSIYTVCGYREAYNIAISDIGTNMVRKQLSQADIVDLLNPLGKDYVSKYVRGKIFLTPGTFTDLKVFSPEEKEKTIVYAAARLDETKNPMLFVEALNLCQKEIREKGYRAIMLGKGKLEEELRTAIVAYGISDILEMPGYGKTSDYTPKSSVFLSIQSMENYPSQSLAEAAASGCYLIITDVGDSRRCANESFASFINDDPEELSHALKEYIELSDDEKMAVVKYARAFAEEKYSIKASKEYFKNLLIEAGRR